MTKRIGTLNIFGEKWPMFVSDKVDDSICGYCDLDKKKIVINESLPTQDIFLDTLYHELLHSLFHRMSYRQSGMPHEMEEIMVDQIAKCLTENFKVIQKIYAKEKNRG